MEKLKQYGFSERFMAEATLYPGLVPGRIAAQHGALYTLVSGQGEGLAEVSGRFRHAVRRPTDFPTVGDFVMADREAGGASRAVIHHVLARKSAFERLAPGGTHQMQVVAANVDTIFLCLALNGNYSLPRLERYLAVAWGSGATPVVVLTKADLCPDLPHTLAEAAAAAAGADVLAASALEEDGAAQLLRYLGPGATASFIGSSGVGKSTLVNLLAGRQALATQAVRRDGKGRHTTTHRQLLLLPQGGVVIDTPGMRELGAESASVPHAFADIDALAARCRFGNCTHRSEPGCAVRAALEAGEVDERRLEHHRKLQLEAGYEGLSGKQIETQKLNRHFGGKNAAKQARNFVKNKRR